VTQVTGHIPVPGHDVGVNTSGRSRRLWSIHHEYPSRHHHDRLATLCIAASLLFCSLVLIYSIEHG
jgi:hypothetical protein